MLGIVHAKHVRFESYATLAENQLLWLLCRHYCLLVTQAEVLAATSSLMLVVVPVLFSPIGPNEYCSGGPWALEAPRESRICNSLYVKTKVNYFSQGKKNYVNIEMALGFRLTDSTLLTDGLSFSSFWEFPTWPLLMHRNHILASLDALNYFQCTLLRCFCRCFQQSDGGLPILLNHCTILYTLCSIWRWLGCKMYIVLCCYCILFISLSWATRRADPSL